MSDDDSPTPGNESTETSIAVLKEKVKLISYTIRHDLVWKESFNPVKMLVYGLVAIVLSAVFAAVLNYVINKV